MTAPLKSDRDLPMKWAIQRLRNFGLAARSLSPTCMVGGRREIELDGLRAYQEAFAVWMADDLYYAAVELPGGGVVESTGFETLDKASAFVKTVYFDMAHFYPETWTPEMRRAMTAGDPPAQPVAALQHLRSAPTIEDQDLDDSDAEPLL